MPKETFDQNNSPETRPEGGKVLHTELFAPAQDTEPEQTKRSGATVDTQADTLATVEGPFLGRLPTPAHIKRALDREIIGNDHAKRTLAVVAYNHLKRAGRQISVTKVQDILERVFHFVDPESEATKEFVRKVTAAARNNRLNTRQDNPLRRQIRAHLQDALDHSMIKPHPKDEKSAKKALAPNRIEEIAGRVHRAIYEAQKTRIEFGDDRAPFPQERIESILKKRFFFPQGDDTPEAQELFARLTRVVQREEEERGTLVRSKKGERFEATVRILDYHARNGHIKIKPNQRLRRKAPRSNERSIEDKLTFEVVKRLAALERRRREGGVPADLQRVKKENLLLLGSTGTGKSLLVKELCRFLDAPFVYLDASAYSEVGYEGRNIAEIPQIILDKVRQEESTSVSQPRRLQGSRKKRQSSRGRAAPSEEAILERAQRAIVFIDEIDKKAHGTTPSSDGKDVSGVGVQNALLTLMEDNVDLESKVDMSGVLFIFAGAFPFLEKITRKRVGSSGIGFDGDPDNSKLPAGEWLKKVEKKDLEKYGIIGEFLGRVRISYTEDIDEDRLKRILVEPQNSVWKQKQRMLEQEGVTLTLKEDGAEEIAQQAAKHKTGARSLTDVLSSVLAPIEFHAPNLRQRGYSEVVIDREFVRKALETP